MNMIEKDVVITIRVTVGLDREIIMKEDIATTMIKGEVTEEGGILQIVVIEITGVEEIRRMKDRTETEISKVNHLNLKGGNKRIRERSLRKR